MRISGELSRRIGSVTPSPDHPGRFPERSRPIELPGGSPSAATALTQRGDCVSAATANPPSRAGMLQRTGITASSARHAADPALTRRGAGSHTENTGGTP